MADPISADPIVFERVIDASPDEAFALFTEPERLRRWQAVTASVDLRVGGEYRYTVVPGSVASGTYSEIEPGRRLVYTWGWHDNETVPVGSSRIEVDLEPVGDKTLVRMTHSGLDVGPAESHEDGWKHYFDRLEMMAATGDAGVDPWHLGIGDLDHLKVAEATWSICQNVMRGFGPGDRDRQTPCSEYTVHELVEHLMESMRNLAGLADGVVPSEIDADSAEDYIAQAVDLTLTAWRQRGTAGDMPFAGGTAPATVLAGILSLEFLVHAWDFAQATDQTLEVPTELVAFVQHLATNTIKPEYRGDDAGFALEATPSSADPLIELMAFTGRTT